MDNPNNYPNPKNNRALTGVLIVAIGAALLLRNLNFPLPYWLFTWPMILIVIGLHSGFKHHFRNTSWIILIAIGSFFLIDDFMPGLRLEPLFWPMLIMAIGVLFIIRPRRRKWEQWQTGNEWRSGFQRADAPTADWEPVNDGNNYFSINSVFSGVKRMVLSKDFKGGSITCVFGGAEINFSQADVNGQVIIRVEQVFGGTKLIVPPDWIIQNEIDGVFHGVEDKRSYQTAVIPNPNKVLILRGTCVFGGVEIKSY